MKINPILASDSYKHSHWEQYPEGTDQVVSYIEARGFSAPFTTKPDIVLFGITAYIQEYLNNIRITQADVDHADKFLAGHGIHFNREGWEIIVNDWGGILPVAIQALPEGTVTTTGIPLVQVRSIDPRLPWVTSWAETQLLRAIWYPTTVATLSREAKKVIKKYLAQTADNLNGLPFKLHDFGARGVSSQESAILGGMGHLVNFMGSDTLESVAGVQEIYETDLMAAYSVPASEHSTMTSWGRENEVDAYRNMLDKFGGGTIVSVVSDSYDVFHACRFLWGEKLKDRVLNMNATLVVRPDSGDPKTVILDLLGILGTAFGTYVNSKGYRMLNDKVRLLQGDGVNIKSIEDILRTMAGFGWSTDNIVFGMGGALLQQVNRDSLKFAMKANEASINGNRVDVYKDPATDQNKRSKRGAQAVVLEGGVLTAVREDEVGTRENLLEVVWAPYDMRMDLQDKLFIPPKFEDVRTRADV